MESKPHTIEISILLIRLIFDFILTQSYKFVSSALILLLKVKDLKLEIKKYALFSVFTKTPTHMIKTDYWEIMQEHHSLGVEISHYTLQSPPMEELSSLGFFYQSCTNNKAYPHILRDGLE